ncbi:DUF6194 family protein [Nocardia seriolae]|uniref:DUF6194 family protein n=1 Tax=Nocardia seriolae TaxID=37332 RepID=UPI001C6355F5
MPADPPERRPRFLHRSTRPPAPRNRGPPDRRHLPRHIHRHPVYATAAWLAVVNPGSNTTPALRQLLTTAHDRARTAFNRHTT